MEIVEGSSSRTIKVMNDPTFSPVQITTVLPEEGVKKPKLVLCDVNSPIYGLYVVVPTTVTDNRGLPHTLEHLIFTGSRDYPDRGHLDRLATICLSTGTNAYTSEDHTCYFVSTASFEGLMKLLPVYLDHIIHPRLQPEDMALEVFSIDETTKEARGVVYCEMKSREYTEADQMDIRLRNYCFADASKNEDAFLETYRWECGGATERISHLSPEEIRAYHAKHYRPEALTVIVSGCIKDEEENAVRAALDSFNYAKTDEEVFSTEILDAIIETVPEPKGEFPADDESIGSVGFAWIGPPATDLRTVMALHILMRALKETTASPLFQEFIECADPCANDIDYDVRGSRRSMISLVFSGVPNGDNNDDSSSEDEEDADGDNDNDKDGDKEMESESEEDSKHESPIQEGYIKARMFAVLERLMEEGSDELYNLVRTALRNFSIKIQEQYQEDPHELSLGYCLPEILTGKPEIGTAITTLPTLLAALAKEESAYWRNLLKEYLMENKCHEVVMKPAREMAGKIREDEGKNIARVIELDRYPKSGAALLEGFSGGNMPEIPLPTLTTTLAGKRTVKTSESLSLQLTRLPSTSFNTVTLGLNIKQCLDKSLWPYLVIFQELLFQCDIQLDADCGILKGGLTKYQDLQKILSHHFTSYEAAIGLGNELFSASYLDSHLILSATVPCSPEDASIPETIQLLLTILKSSRFTKDRVAVTVENLVGHLADSKRDPSTVIDAIFTDHAGCVESCEGENPSKRTKTEEQPHISKSISIFTQEPLLAALKDTGIPDDLIEKLNLIAQSLGNLAESGDGLGSFIHVGVGLNEGNNWDDSQVDSIFRSWEEAFPKNTNLDKSLVETPCFPAPESLPRYRHLKDLPKDLTVIVPTADVTASFVATSVPINLLPVLEGSTEKHGQAAITEYLSLAILCHMLSFTEGPLYNRIRGKGLAYGAYLSLSLWNGLLSFDLNDSTAPIEALNTFLELTREVIAECEALTAASGDQDGGVLGNKILCESTLATAKASFAFTNISDRSTPSSIFSLSLRSVVRGGYPSVEPEEHNALLKTLQTMKLADIAASVLPHLRLFLDPSKRVTIAVIPPSIKETVLSGLSACGMNPLVRTLHL